MHPRVHLHGMRSCGKQSFPLVASARAPPGHKDPASAHGMRWEYAAGVVGANGGRSHELRVGRFSSHLAFFREFAKDDDVFYLFLQKHKIGAELQIYLEEGPNSRIFRKMT
jgi:hypothetical protein